MKYLDHYNRFKTNENNLSINNMEKLFNYLLSDKLKEKTKDFLQKCNEEIDDYKEVGQILKKATLNNTITKEEKKIVLEQLIDTLKIGSTGALFLVPFGSILIIALIKIGDKLGINFLPSAWDKTNESVDILDDDKLLGLNTYDIYKLNEIDNYIKLRGDLDRKNSNGNTIMMYASIRLDYDVIEKLLKNGANPNIKDDKGRTCAYDLFSHEQKRITSTIHKQYKILKLLSEYDLNWNSKDEMEETFIESCEIYEEELKIYCPKEFEYYLNQKNMDEFNI